MQELTEQIANVEKESTEEVEAKEIFDPKIGVRCSASQDESLLLEPSFRRFDWSVTSDSMLPFNRQFQKSQHFVCILRIVHEPKFGFVIVQKSRSSHLHAISQK